MLAPTSTPSVSDGSRGAGTADGSRRAGTAAARWFALRVRSRHEKAVAGALAGCGFEVYLPALKELRQWSDRRRMVEVPLFPGYLFIRCPMGSGQRVDILRASRGIVEIVGVRGVPAPIPDLEIASVQTLLAARASVTPVESLPQGARVRVISGPLAGVVGVVETHKGRRRIVCAVQLLGRSVLADFDHGDVEEERP